MPAVFFQTQRDRISQGCDFMRTVHYITAAATLTGAVQSLFFALLLADVSGGRPTSNRLLMALLVVLSAGLLSIFGDIVCENRILLAVSHVSMPAGIACVPLFSLYVKSLTDTGFTFSSKNLFHFTPSLLLSLYGIVVDTPLSGFIETPSLAPGDHLTVMRFILIPYSIPYLCTVFKQVKRHSRRTAEICMKNRHIDRYISDELSIHLWLRALLAAFLVYLLMSAAALVPGNPEEFNAVIAITSTVIIYLAGFTALQNPCIFNRHRRNCANVNITNREGTT